MEPTFQQLCWRTGMTFFVTKSPLAFSPPQAELFLLVCTWANITAALN